MTTPYLAELLVEARGTELRREAARARLATLVRCCRPSAAARMARRAGAAVTRLRTIRSGSTTTCCAPA